MPPVVQAIEPIIVLSGAVAWAWLEWRIWHRQPILPYEPRRPVPWGFLHVLAVAACFVVLQDAAVRFYFTADELKQLTDGDTSPGLQYRVITINMGVTAITLLLAVALLVFHPRATRRDLGLNARRLPYDVVCGTIAMVAIAPVLFGLQWIFLELVKIEYKHPLIESLGTQPDRARLLAIIFAAVVVAPVFEEFFFRVIFQGWLEKAELLTTQLLVPVSPSVGPPESEQPVDPSTSCPPATEASPPLVTTAQRGWLRLPLGTVPILISSTVFASLHMGQGAAPVPLFFFGLVLGFLYHRTHRLAPSLICHILLNGVSMLVIVYSVYS